MNAIPISKWESSGQIWPTYNGWHAMIKNETKRAKLIEAGVLSRMGRKWIVFPDRWQEYLANNNRADD